MKVPLIKYLLLAVLWLLILPVSAVQAERQVVIATGEWAPWTGEDLPRYGFVNDVVERAFSHQGYQVEFQFYPWKRSYYLVDHGKVPAASYVYDSDVRREMVDYSDPITEERIVFFVEQGTQIDYDTLSDLAGLTIGVTRGNTYTDEFRKLIDEGVLSAEMVNTDLINFRKLLAGRIDALPAAELQGIQLLRQHFEPEIHDRIEVLPKPLSTTTGHLMFSRKWTNAEELLADFNTGLQHLRDTGIYERLYADMRDGAYGALPDSR